MVRAINNLITRKTAIDAFKKWFWESLFIYPSMSLDEIEKFELLLYRYPVKQKGRKKGRWSKPFNMGTYKYQCSECEKLSRAMYDFCPNCGADMRGESDDLY
jgi:hypothetical protein